MSSHPTAAGLVADRLAARAQAQHAAQLRELERIRATLPLVVEALVGRFGAKRVLLFGSVATSDLTGDLDLDLAVEGLLPARHFEAAAVVSGIARTDVDLVPIEDMSDRLAALIAAEGVVLHG